MAETQKIHPIDVEAARSPPPTAPLVPRGTIKSDNGDPGLAESRHPFPPFRRTIPFSHSKPPPKKRSCCCRCICWTFCLLLLLIVILAAVVGILFLVFQPKLPKYTVDRMQITQFNLSADSSLSATFEVSITAQNPNKKIGIYYEDGSHISVWYIETKLCEGSLPKFYQGHRNTTMLNLPLTGQTQNANGLLTALQEQQQQTGNIPLNLKVNQPVRVKLGKLKLMKVKFSVKCQLLVDNLSANNNISIQNSSCKFKFTL